MRWLFAALALCALPAGASAAYEPAEAGGGLPPFLAKMTRHAVTVNVRVFGADGATKPAGAGLKVGLAILAQGTKVRDYHAVTDDAGVATFPAIPANAVVQESIAYEIWADHGGVRFPFQVKGVPAGGASVDLTVTEVTDQLTDVFAEHAFIEIFPDEESLFVRQQIKLHNRGKKAVNLSLQPDGGLAIPTPEGAKHAEVHKTAIASARGTTVYVEGVLLPEAVSQPAMVEITYTLPYSASVFEWSQTLAIPTSSVLVVVPQDKQSNMKAPIPLGLKARGGFGAVAPSTVEGSRQFELLRSEGAKLAAGEPLRFAISGIPAPSAMSIYATLGGSLAALLAVFLFGGRTAGQQLSRAHLVEERDRLVRALARMKKAVDKGKMSEGRFVKEEEVITARLVSLYRALDRLEAR